MEQKQIEELWKTYICPQRKLKRSKEAKEKKRYIKKAYPLEFGPDGKTLLVRGPWTQQERDIYLQICKKYETACQQNQTKELFQEILQQIPTRNLTQVKGYHANHNPYQTIEIKENKRFRRTKLQMGQEKLKEFALKNKWKKQIKQLEKLSNLNNQILTLETQIVQFNFEDGKQIEIKVFINMDLLLNLNTIEDQKLEKDEIKTENLDNVIIDEAKEQNTLQRIQKDKIIVKLRNKNEVKVEEEVVESSFIDDIKLIGFKELLYLIKLEKKFNNKQLDKQIIKYQFEKPKKILINVIQQKKDDLLQIEQKQNDNNQDKQIQQTIQPIKTQNMQEILLPLDKQQTPQNQFNVDNKNNVQNINNNIDKSKIIFLDSQEQGNQQQNSIIIIDNNDNLIGQQQKQHNNNNNKSNSLIKQQKKQKNVQDSQIIESSKVKKPELNQQLQQNQEIDSIIENEYIKTKETLQQLNKIKKQIIKEKKSSIEKQKLQEYDRLKDIELEKEIQIELEKERQKQLERDKQQEIQRQKKLEQQKEKEKQREKIKEKRLQFCNENDRKERNRTKNRELRSLQELNSQQFKIKNKDSNQLEILNNQDYLSSKQSNQIKQQQEVIQQQIVEYPNQQYQQQQIDQNLPSYIPQQFQIPILDQMQQQQYYIKQVQGNQYYALKDCYQPLQYVEGFENNLRFQPQYQNQQESKNQIPELNNLENPQYAQLVPIPIQNYIQFDRNNQLQQQDQAISQPQQQGAQPQPTVAYQPAQAYLGNHYFYPQFMPVRQIQQQAQAFNDGQQNLNNDQFQVEIMYLYQEVPQNFDPNFFFQQSPQSFVSIPGGSKLGDALK